MEPTSAKPRPKPLVAVILVAVPLVAILVAAVVTTTRSNEGASTATTISQSGDPAAAGSSGKKGGGDSSTTAPKGDDKGKDQGKSSTTTSDPKAAEREPDIPTNPGDAGPEGERTSVTYPQPTVPESGCSRPSGTAVITLGSAPKPACLRLGSDQEVIVRNRTGKEISFVAISVNEVISAGSEMRIGTAGSAFGEGRSTFWSPGNPQLSGLVIVG